ncbi:MAG: FAD-dependent oxidoreductase [Burkholderiales bacterium]
MKYEVIIIGSGAGGSAAAYRLAQSGVRVLVIEKGLPLPRDGSTLDPDAVMRRGAFLSDEPWTDRQGNTVVPEEHFNLGGKTKWYGAALLRMAPHEFTHDHAHQCLPWPVSYEEMAPYYEAAEQLLGVRTFPPEEDLQRIVAGLRRQDSSWRKYPMPLGLSADILGYEQEAKHYDAFASVRGMKAEAEKNFLGRIQQKSNIEILAGKAVKALLPDPFTPARVSGVMCDDGTRFEASVVMLAAGALHSPRLLQTYMESNGLDSRLPAYAHVGRHYKAHVLTAMMVFSRRIVRDVLCKTLLVLSDKFPHSSVQTLGGNLAGEIVRLQAPVPGWMAQPFAKRAYGLFLQTEDGSHRDNRIVAAANGGTPTLDYDLARTLPAQEEHRALVRTLRRQMLRLGYLPVAKSIPITGTAHACGTLVAGKDPATSVTDAEGRVHGMENLYVVDGSVLPRSSRVNPALTIYAWGLRVASRLRKGEIHGSRAARFDSVRA